MNQNSAFVAAVVCVSATVALSAVASQLVPLDRAGWGEGGWGLLLGALACLVVVAMALHRELGSRQGNDSGLPEIQSQAWLQRHLMECTATLDSVGHESATPNLLSGGANRRS